MNRYKLWIAYSDDTPAIGHYKAKQEAKNKGEYWSEQDNCIAVIITDTYTGKRIHVWHK